MVRIVDGDLFAARDVDIIAHQVNCQGVMGSGVALQVRKLFPDVFDGYKSLCAIADKALTGKKFLLGHTQFIEAPHQDRHVWIANMFAQFNFGYDGAQYTDYAAFRSCLRSLRNLALTCTACGQARIGMPFKIGCDRGGADWETVYSMIETELVDCNVTLYRLSSKQ